MRLRNLERYQTGGTANRIELGIPLPKTPASRVYRYSPNENAPPRHFVMGDAKSDPSTAAEKVARMKLMPRSKQTVCPYSGVVAADDDFTHPEDREAAVETVKQAVLAEFTDMLRNVGRNFQRRSGSGVSFKVTAPNKVRPRFHRKDLYRTLTCDHCGRDYGVYAIGLFCPDCGAPNLRLHFAREIELVEEQVKLAEVQSETSQEFSYRLLGNAHEDVLTAFEATLKTVYFFAKRSADPIAVLPNVGNAFQNIERGSKYFSEVGISPYTVLNPQDLDILKLNIQKRHIIGHNLGIVDVKFAEHSAEAKVGETTHLVGGDIHVFARLAQSVINTLDDWLAGAVLPQSPSSENAAPSAAPQLPQPTKTPAERSAEELRLSTVACRLACFLVKASPFGLDDPIDEDKVIAAFADVELPVLKEAIAELSIDNHVSAIERIGLRIPRMRLQTELFATFDRFVFGTDPIADAAHLAQMVLDTGSGIGVSDLHKDTGWEKRRFNPALGIVLEYIDSRRMVRGGIADYPAHHFTPNTEERVELKRFIARMNHT